MKNPLRILHSIVTVAMLSCTTDDGNLIEVNADFSSNVNEITEGGSIIFSDVSSGSPISWNWSFDGGTPSSSNSQNPVIVYATPGVYDVSLTVSNSDTEDTETKAGYITVTEESLPTSPPFAGTSFVDPDILTENDPTEFIELISTGQGSRTMFDRRVNDWVTVNAHLFEASFTESRTIEIQVNPEFDFNSAEEDAEKYATVIGRLPAVLLKDVETVWIHKGEQPFGGGNNNLLIHTDQGVIYENDNVLEEIFIHESAHTSLDSEHASAPAWIEAQNNDPVFSSTYAQENSDTEDIAESFLLYIAVRYRSDRISESLKNTIEAAIPNRIQYFENQSFDMTPLE